MPKISYPNTKELTALRFDSDADFDTALDLYVETSPDSYMALGGRNTLVILNDDSGWLIDRLESRGVVVKRAPVESSADLPPHDASTRRGDRGRVPGLNRKKVIEELRKKYRSTLTVAT
jgi:hypothetical protein